tara:strand:+ start:4306 stop:6561 length:2256 start_codon:yes stop_codon:yes gene_type:complete
MYSTNLLAVIAITLTCVAGDTAQDSKDIVNTTNNAAPSDSNPVCSGGCAQDLSNFYDKSLVNFTYSQIDGGDFHATRPHGGTYTEFFLDDTIPDNSWGALFNHTLPSTSESRNSQWMRFNFMMDGCFNRTDPQLTAFVEEEQHPNGQNYFKGRFCVYNGTYEPPAYDFTDNMQKEGGSLDQYATAYSNATTVNTLSSITDFNSKARTPWRPYVDANSNGQPFCTPSQLEFPPPRTHAYVSESLNGDIFLSFDFCNWAGPNSGNYTTHVVSTVFLCGGIVSEIEFKGYEYDINPSTFTPLYTSASTRYNHAHQNNQVTIGPIPEEVWYSDLCKTANTSATPELQGQLHFCKQTVSSVAYSAEQMHLNDIYRVYMENETESNPWTCTIQNFAFPIVDNPDSVELQHGIFPFGTLVNNGNGGDNTGSVTRTVDFTLDHINLKTCPAVGGEVLESAALKFQYPICHVLPGTSLEIDKPFLTSFIITEPDLIALISDDAPLSVYAHSAKVVELWNEYGVPLDLVAIKQAYPGRTEWDPMTDFTSGTSGGDYGESFDGPSKWKSTIFTKTGNNLTDEKENHQKNEVYPDLAPNEWIITGRFRDFDIRMMTYTQSQNSTSMYRGLEYSKVGLSITLSIETREDGGRRRLAEMPLRVTVTNTPRRLQDNSTHTHTSTPVGTFGNPKVVINKQHGEDGTGLSQFQIGMLTLTVIGLLIVGAGVYLCSRRKNQYIPVAQDGGIETGNSRLTLPTLQFKSNF